MRQNTFKPSKKIPRKINKHASAVMLCKAPTHWHARGHGFWVSSLKCRKKVGLESLKDPQGHTGEKLLHFPRLFNSEYYNARIGVQSADQCQVLQYREWHTVRGTIPSAAMRELEHNAWIQYRVQQENGVQGANLILSAKVLGMPHNARIQHRLPQ